VQEMSADILLITQGKVRLGKVAKVVYACNLIKTVTCGKLEANISHTPLYQQRAEAQDGI